MILRFLHGWGFDAGLWRPVAALLPEFACQLADRGYFSQSRTPAETGPVVLVGHSFGAMLALRRPLAGCRGLIAVNGFDRFTASDGFPGVPPRLSARMIARFRLEPGEVLTAFRRRCGYAQAYGNIEIERLAADLEALHEWDCRADAGRLSAPILCLQGGADPILPPDMREAVFASAARVDRVTHASAGHLLPLSDPAFCAAQIRAFVERTA